MAKNYYYSESDDYFSIKDRKVSGEFQVPVVHSAVLVDLRHIASEFLTFDKMKLNQLHNNKYYDGPVDDMIVFAISANFSQTQMWISNSFQYGFIPSAVGQLDKTASLINLKSRIVNRHDTVHILPNLRKFVTYPEKSRLTFAEIYMINLKRRPERRLKQEASLKEHGIDCTFVEAVDGKDLTEKTIVEKGLKFLGKYEHKYDKRRMTIGEVGCFLSHYNIWEKIVKDNQQEVLILEDDIEFDYDFNKRIVAAMDEARKLGGWDFIYFSRASHLKYHYDIIIPNTKTFVKADYSVWANAYVLTLEGAKKLLAAKPLQKLLPVDEFFPIMYDMHYNDTWKQHFQTRNLVAWAFRTSLIMPTHAYAQVGHVSDTSNSTIISEELLIAASVKRDSTEL